MMWIDFQVWGLRQEKSSNMLSVQMPFIKAAWTHSDGHHLLYIFQALAVGLFYDLQSNLNFMDQDHLDFEFIKNNSWKYVSSSRILQWLGFCHAYNDKVIVLVSTWF